MYVYIIYIYYLKADVPRPMVTQIREEEKKKLVKKLSKMPVDEALVWYSKLNLTKMNYKWVRR